MVSSVNIDDMDHSKRTMRGDTVEYVTGNVLTRMCEDMECRRDVGRATNG
jgi:hypothetical protein